jgi:zinc transporter
MIESITQAQSYVHGVVLNGDGSATPLDQTSSLDKPLWVHLDYSLPDCAETLSSLGLSDNIIESLVRTTTRPRTIADRGGFMIFLRAVNLNPGDEPDDMVSLRVWLEQDRLITVRQRKVYSIQDIRREMEAGNGPEHIQQLFILIVERLADRISEYVDNIEEKVGEFEESIESSNSNQVRVAVSSLRRQSAMVRRYLAPQRDALDFFHRQCRSILNEVQAFELQEQTDRIIRYVEDLDLVRERCLVLQEELMNRIAQEQNARMYVLSIVAAVFLPISFVTGLFGMNVAGLPGLEAPAAFALVAGFMAAIAGGILLYFKFKKWF